MSMMMTRSLVASPIGPILIEASDLCVAAISILPGAAPTDVDGPRPGSIAAEAGRQLAAYFEDRRTRFDLPLMPAATARGEALRAAIAAVPAGETLSYGALARIAGSAPRAIGQACARNRFPIVIPCHRVVGSGGAIGHYSGGRGIATKAWLLDHERRAAERGELL